jgi:hypothetical protein
MITDDEVRRLLFERGLIRGAAQLKENASSKCIRPIVADHTQDKYGGFDIAVVLGLRFEKIVH